MKRATATQRFLPTALVGLILLIIAGCSSTPTESDILAEANRRGPGEAIPYLVGLLKSPDPQTQDAAFRAICHWNAEGQDSAVQALLNADDIELRCYAVYVLLRTGRDAVETMPVLTSALRNSNPRVRAFAAGLVSEIGPPACSAVPALAKMVDEDTGLPFLRAVTALGDIGDPSVLPVLESKLNQIPNVAQPPDAQSLSAQDYWDNPWSKRKNLTLAVAKLKKIEGGHDTP